MSDDLRTTAFRAIRTASRLAEMFPARSPGRTALRRAVRSLALDYIATSFDKKRHILDAIRRHNTRVDDIVAETGIGRREIEALLAELVADGHLLQAREQPPGPGRPFSRYSLSPEFLKLVGK